MKIIFMQMVHDSCMEGIILKKKTQKKKQTTSNLGPDVTVQCKKEGKKVYYFTSARIHQKPHFPEHSATYKHDHYRLQSPPQHSPSMFTTHMSFNHAHLSPNHPHNLYKYINTDSHNDASGSNAQCVSTWLTKPCILVFMQYPGLEFAFLSHF